MIRLEIDGTRPRVVRGLVRAFVDGSSFDVLTDAMMQNTFIEPVTSCLMLRPNCLSSTWYNSATGANSRFNRFQYRTLSGSTLPDNDWAMNHRRIVGDIYLESRLPTATNYAVFAPGPYPRNQPVYLSLFVPSGAAQNAVAIECGWGEPGAAGTVSLRVFVGGDADVYKGTVRVGRYQGAVKGGREQKTGSDAPGASFAGRPLDLYLIPFRRRDLLVFTSANSGFSHTFSDLSPDSVGTITPAGRFWWRVPSGKASVQFAPMTFPTSGFAHRKIQTLRVAPPATGNTWDFFGSADLPGYGSASYNANLVSADGSAFVPDGVKKDVRVKVALTGDGTCSPFFYNSDITLRAKTANTNGTAKRDIAAFTRRFSISVPDDPAGVRANIVIENSTGTGKLNLAKPFVSNRPIEARLGVSTGQGLLLVGVTGEASQEERQRVVGDTPPLITMDIRDLWAQLEAARYEEDAVPLDGLILSDAVHELLRHAGIPDSEMDLEETPTFYLPYSAAAAGRGEWSYQPKAGDTVAQWILRLREDFAPVWFIGWRPGTTGPKFQFRSEATLPTAIAATGHLNRNGNNTRFAVRKFTEKILPPEATRVSVYGFDPATRQFLLDSWVDASLEDPTLAPAARPAGWRGEVVPFVLVEPRLTTAAAVTRAKDQIVARIGAPVRLAEWTSTLLGAGTGEDRTTPPVWRGDKVRIVPYGDYRVLSFSGELSSENADAPGVKAWRTFSYVGKWLNDIPPSELAALL